MATNLANLRNLFLGSDEQFQELVKAFTKVNGVTSFDEEKFNIVVLEPLTKLRFGLMVVDYQNDFISGSLAIGNGPANQDPLEALPLINNLVGNKNWSVVIFSKDWHPADHISFVEHAFDPDREIMDIYRNAAKAFQLVKFTTPDREQTLFPTHCVENTWGAELHPGLKIPMDAKMIFKGSDKFRESYSCFGEEKERSDAEDILRQHNIDAVFCLGLAYDICVAQTVHSAANLGFLSSLVTDASKGLSKEEMTATNNALNAKNVALLNTEDVIAVIEGKKIPIEWAKALMSKAK